MQEEKQSGQFAALIGLDWADRKHDVCLQVPGRDKLERSIVEHRPVALEAWLDGLRERFGGARVAVAVELEHGPIVSALLEYDFIVVFPVNPGTLARYRKAFVPSNAKDDSARFRSHSANLCATKEASSSPPAIAPGARAMISPGPRFRTVRDEPLCDAPVN